MKSIFGSYRKPRKFRGVLTDKPPSREPVSAKKKKAVKERAGNKCEWRGCRERRVLQFHHKNIKNWDDRVSNIMLLCPTHHALIHRKFKRKVVGKTWLGENKTRLVKVSTKKKVKHKWRKRSNGGGYGGFGEFKFREPKFKNVFGI